MSHYERAHGLTWIPAKRIDSPEPPRPHDPGAPRGEALKGYTLYCKPLDNLSGYTVRGWTVDQKSGGEPRPDNTAAHYATKAEAEQAMQGRGLVWIPRHTSDDLCIVGSWV